MKKILLFLMMLLTLSATTSAQSYTRSDNTFISSTGELKAKQEPVKTKFTWKDSKGKEYPIYVSKNGSCFVIKVSAKTGKEYRNYLGTEISSQICKELNIEYKPKKSK